MDKLTNNLDEIGSHPIDILASAFVNSSKFNLEIFQTFSEAYFVYLETVVQNNTEGMKDFAGLERMLRSKTRNLLDTRFRSEDFVNILSEYVASFSKLADISGFGDAYQYSSNLLALWNNYFIEPIRDAFWRTPSEKISELERYSLFVYKKKENRADISSSAATNKKYPKTPLLIVYAFINRHYILDLLPEISVIRNLLSNDFDVYATDWGTPAAYDKDLTINHFINKYMDKSVDLIRQTTQSHKVTLFGYCWGGNLVLAYAAMHPEKVRNVITVATPGDLSLDDTLLSIWTKKTKVDALLDAFGNVPGVFLDAAFTLRNPIEYSHKYPHFFERPHDLDSVMEFFATETWLHDTKPVIGEIYREFVKYIYQQNLFIKNQMRIDDKPIDLKNVSMPFLNVIAEKDDLVSYRSSAALNSAVGSTDKGSIEFQSGHVGMIIGHRAHKDVWPKVGAWLKERS